MEIDLKTAKLTTPIEKYLEKKQPNWIEWMVGFRSKVLSRRNKLIN
jgi:hypothetical protein